MQILFFYFSQFIKAMSSLLIALTGQNNFFKAKKG